MRFSSHPQKGQAKDTLRAWMEKSVIEQVPGHTLDGD